MRVTVLDAASIILATAIATQTAWAETVFIELTQDNTMYQQAQGNLSNGSGDHIFVGHNAAGDIRRAPIWLTSELVTLDQLVFGQAIEFPRQIGVSGTFSNPTHSSELQSYGLLSVIFDSCTTGEFTLNGPGGHKVSNILKLIGVEGTQCQ